MVLILFSITVCQLRPVTFLKDVREIDDYAKDGGPGVIRLLCSFYHEPLRSLICKRSLITLRFDIRLVSN